MCKAKNICQLARKWPRTWFLGQESYRKGLGKGHHCCCIHFAFTFLTYNVKCQSICSWAYSQLYNVCNDFDEFFVCLQQMQHIGQVSHVFTRCYCSWEGNCRSGVALLMCHRLSGIPSYPPMGSVAYEREVSSLTLYNLCRIYLFMWKVSWYEMKI